MPENHPENAHYPYDTNRVRELLKSHRKTRGFRSCFPCRHRKVRCDGLVPCSSCVKRGHRELCRLPTEERGWVVGLVGTGTASSEGSGSGTGSWGGGLDLDVMYDLVFPGSNISPWVTVYLVSAQAWVSLNRPKPSHLLTRENRRTDIRLEGGSSRLIGIRAAIAESLGSRATKNRKPTRSLALPTTQ
ncbi:Zn(II)2Cys6 transcription factor domain-containing protein [Aspergillus affinis]|uniref:Zn(II)2Cys6 transcription factor domain-containing protein n=1 Tax=Aspergillus affinis TaxID=1070780 RepID=UPI0022FE4FC6|nr:Zn(II)2Cys6 transcription factor [Aspergillus affinis]KAI9037325.1 Zn(II)2Cys6 transcription factor [Aspergillus affinis]